MEQYDVSCCTFQLEQVFYEYEILSNFVRLRIHFDKKIFIFLEHNDICHLLKTSRDNFLSPPPHSQYFQKRKGQLIYYIFCVSLHF